MKNIEILLMVDNNMDTIGGAEKSTEIIINGIKNNYSLGVIQPGDIVKPVTGVRYYSITPQTRLKHLIKRPFLFIKYIWMVKRNINRENPGIIHTQAQVSFFIVALLRKFKLIPKNIELIHTERGLYTKYGKFINAVFHFFMKELDVLVTTTEFNMKYWKAAIQEKGLSMDFKIIENTAGEIFESYDDHYTKKDNEILVLGFAGRYEDWKDWPLAVEISEKLNHKLGEKLHVHMAVGCLDDVAEKETKIMFNQLTEIFGTRFQGEINISLEAMDKFYYGIDVFILTSNYNTESFGRTLVEAMSRKTIVLTTNAGGSVEVVGNPKNVCDTADKFVERVLAYNDDKNIMTKEKEANMQRVKENYSLHNNIVKHLNIYNDFMKVERIKR